jgi:hypothetical protein
MNTVLANDVHENDDGRATYPAKPSRVIAASMALKRSSRRN